MNITTNGKNKKDIFPVVDSNGNTMEIPFIDHSALGQRIVTINVAAKFLGVSSQTIYTRIKDNKDPELTKNLVLHKYRSPATGEERRRFYFKLDYVVKAAANAKPPIAEIKDEITRLYYIIYDILEDTVPVFRKSRDDEQMFANMKNIDKMITGYIASKAPDITGEKLSPKKRSIIYFSLSSFHFSSYEDTELILSALRLMIKELENGHYGENLSSDEEEE